MKYKNIIASSLFIWCITLMPSSEVIYDIFTNEPIIINIDATVDTDTEDNSSVDLDY